MTIDAVTQILVAVLGLAGVVLPTIIAARVQRRAQQSDVDSIVTLLNTLPEQSQTRSRVEPQVESLILRLIERSQHRREPAGLAFALTFMAVAVVGGIGAFNAGGPWLWALVPAGIVFILGALVLAADGDKRERRRKVKAEKARPGT